MKRFSILAGCVLALAWATTLAHAAANAPLKVVSLSTVLSDLARNVGGDKVQVIELVKAGVDPHEFQPSPGDVQQVAGADVVLVSGKGLEGYLSRLEQSSGGGSGKFVDVGSGVGPSLRLKEDKKTVEDPHWWHSIANVKKAVGVVRDAFGKADPADGAAFAAAATAYSARLDALDKEIKLKVAELPREKRKLVTSHDAFQYFARDYGFRIYPIEGVSTEAQPSSKDVAELIETIKKQGVKAVFFENIENPKVVAAITQETGAKVGGELYADGLGAPDSDAATYEAMMRHNVTTIVNALK
ncbi:MAG: zinc ABC transporter substrate-binding protein [Verrucomicrobia bacterium]|nr:zinc ABC transporter substrate-binding protein [Verrucomicrobiota bacterium]MBV9658936.1 zinc ABC transporter substrate-binding protein [Verrucomicrobiota bacterium]